MCHFVAFACVPSKRVPTNSTLPLLVSVKPVAQRHPTKRISVRVLVTKRTLQSECDI